MIVALHEAVRREIMRRVKAKAYRADHPLPSAAALAREFAVSAITVKRALRDLQTAGILRSVPGRGTFIRKQQRFIRDLCASFNSLQDARRLGLDVTVRLISIGREHLLDPAFDVFAPPARAMLCVRKVILIDRAPLMHDTTYIPFAVEDAVIDEFGHKFVLEALGDHGMQFAGTKLLIDAAPASRQAQETFDIPNGYPTLRRLYRLKATGPGIFILGVAEAPFDRLACMVAFPPPSQGEPAIVSPARIGAGPIRMD